jgi:hypothetical protein
MEWKRQKEIPSQTHRIETSCGKMFMTLGFEDEKLIEVSARIGKSGICPCVLLDTTCKLISMYLQSPEPRYKIVKKFKKQFMDMSGCESGKFKHEDREYNCCADFISKVVIKEIEKQIS